VNVKKFRRPAIIAILVVAALFLIPFLIPMGSYIGRIEAIANEALGSPVKIGSLRLALLPTPRVNAGNVIIGNDQELVIDDVAVVPDILSLFSDVKTVSVIKVHQAVVKKSALNVIDKLAEKSEHEPAGPKKVVIREIVLKKTKLVWPDMQLPEFDAALSLTEANRPESAEILSADGDLKVKLEPGGEAYLIHVTADRWKIPVGPPFLLDKLDMQMTLRESRLDITKIDADLYDGKITGSGALNWENNWRLNGKLNVDHLAVKEPVALLSKGTQLSGKLFGDGNYSANAESPAALLDKLQAAFRFRVDNGVLYGVDLAKAATLLLRGGHQGGETKFDEMSGLVKVSGKQYHLQSLNVVSGLLTATGQVKILPNKQLDGVIDVDLKKGVSLATVPLKISGTVSKPEAFPTKAAMAGAVAGTAVLGPGVGTTLGVKAGSALEKMKGLFGGSDEE
jgi:uncharacterized protein involved in outer membrane biogenesis